MVAYNQRILATSASLQRRHRARRMLANLRPHVVRLEAAVPLVGEVVPVEAPAAAVSEAFEVVWSGAAKRVSLIGDRETRA